MQLRRRLRVQFVRGHPPSRPLQHQSPPAPSSFPRTPSPNRLWDISDQRPQQFPHGIAFLCSFFRSSRTVAQPSLALSCPVRLCQRTVGRPFHPFKCPKEQMLIGQHVAGRSVRHQTSGFAEAARRCVSTLKSIRRVESSGRPAWRRAGGPRGPPGPGSSWTRRKAGEIRLSGTPRWDRRCA